MYRLLTRGWLLWPLACGLSGDDSGAAPEGGSSQSDCGLGSIDSAPAEGVASADGVAWPFYTRDVSLADIFNFPNGDVGLLGMSLRPRMAVEFEEPHSGHAAALALDGSVRFSFPDDGKWMYRVRPDGKVVHCRALESFDVAGNTFAAALAEGFVVAGPALGLSPAGVGAPPRSMGGSAYHLARFDAGGRRIWAVPIEPPPGGIEPSDGVVSVTLRRPLVVDDSVLVSGEFEAGGKALSTVRGDFFLGRYSAVGEVLWFKNQAPLESWAPPIVQGDQIIVAGTISKPIILGGGEPGEVTLTPTDFAHLVIARYSVHDGTLLRASLANFPLATLSLLRAPSDGDLEILASVHASSIELGADGKGPVILTPWVPGSDGAAPLNFLARLDAERSLIEATRLFQADSRSAGDAATIVAANGDLLVSRETSTSVPGVLVEENAQTITLTPRAGELSSALVARYEPRGGMKWAARVDGAMRETVMAPFPDGAALWRGEIREERFEFSPLDGAGVTVDRGPPPWYGPTFVVLRIAP